jgi:microcystin degradation protein MlrC
MKLFLATLATETNTFATFPTGLADFEGCLLVRDGIAGQPDGLWTSPAKVWHRLATGRGWEVAEGIHAFAEPGGTVVRRAYERLRDEILERLEASLPVDGVLLCLHGAMVADGYDDCEGDTLRRVRALVGPDVPVGVELDLHAQLTPEIVSNATAIVGYKAYPHTDYAERARDLFEIMAATLAGHVRPVMATFRCPTLGLYPTTRPGPMPAFVEAMERAEREEPGILSVSLLHGFPWADIPDVAAHMLVVADGDRGRAATLAERLGRQFFASREGAALAWTPMEEALDRAQAASEFPVLLADTSDQVGGGAAGDSTWLLHAMLERGMRDVAMAPFWDPLAVHYCMQAGEGGRFTLRIGGKSGPHAGAPVDLQVEVKAVFEEAVQDGPNGEPTRIGRAAVVEAQGIEILLTNERHNIFSPTMFTRQGIDLEAKRFIVVKGLYRYWDSFRPLCADMMLLATPGACDPDWAKVPYTRLARPIWPLDPVELPG